MLSGHASVKLLEFGAELKKFHCQMTPDSASTGDEAGRVESINAAIASFRAKGSLLLSDARGQLEKRPAKLIESLDDMALEFLLR
jgi:hypothetical protein